MLEENMFKRLALFWAISTFFLVLAVYERLTYGQADPISTFGAMSSVLFTCYAISYIKKFNK